MRLPTPNQASTAKAQPAGGSGSLQPNLVTDCYKERHGSNARGPAEIRLDLGRSSGSNQVTVCY